jgi:hypothetical protein
MLFSFGWVSAAVRLAAPAVLLLYSYVNFTALKQDRQEESAAGASGRRVVSGAARAAPYVSQLSSSAGAACSIVKIVVNKLTYIYRT